MRIVVSCGSPAWGGTERMAEVLATGLQQRGHEVVLFCRRGSILHQRVSPLLECEPILKGGDFHPLTIARALAALRRRKPDVVLAHTVKDPRWTGVAARALGIPMVYRQEIDEQYRDRLYYRITYGMLPSAIIVNSAATRDSILASVDWIPPERLVLIPNGIDIPAMEGAPEADLGIADASMVFGFVGRWEVRKGIAELAAAWPLVVAVLPDAHLAITGWGESEEEFRRSLAGVRNVRWLGFRDDVPSVMKSIDILVAPSHYEAFGLILAEAMTVGTPVITTLASSMPEIVSDGVEGRVVPVHDPAALAAAMIQLGADRDLRERMGEAARARAIRDYSAEVMLDRHEALLGDIAGGAAGHRRRPYTP